MNQETAIAQLSLICPFTGKDLIELSEKEINRINLQISEGTYFFYHGAPVNVELKQAFISSNHTYIYPVFDDILFLKKLTAIVPKNRTQEPNKRVPDHLANEFYKEFGFGEAFKKEKAKSIDLQSGPLDAEQIRDLGKLFPRSGQSFVSVVTHDIDSIHNLVFGTHFDHYMHLDFSFDRLRSVVGQLKAGTHYILADLCDLPLKTDSVDGLFSFDYINQYDKATQKEAYSEMRRSMLSDGVSILLYEQNKPLHAKSQHKAERTALKAMKFVKPWKRAKIPSIYFYPVGGDQNTDHQNFVVKTSLGSQFS